MSDDRTKADKAWEARRATVDVCFYPGMFSGDGRPLSRVRGLQRDGLNAQVGTLRDRARFSQDASL
jgi:hypothetical protein